VRVVTVVSSPPTCRRVESPTDPFRLLVSGFAMPSPAAHQPTASPGVVRRYRAGRRRPSACRPRATLSVRLQLRGTPGLGRILALPAGLLAAAAVANGLAWTVVPPSRWLHVAAVSFAIFGCYQLVRSVRVLVALRLGLDRAVRLCLAGRAALLAAPPPDARRRAAVDRRVRLRAPGRPAPADVSAGRA
jgi:hypothetical protein